MSRNFPSAWAEEFSGSTAWVLAQLAVSIALGVKAWLVWANSAATPTEVFAWMLALLVYVVGVVVFHAWRAWQKQRDRVAQLERQLDDTAPFFTAVDTGIKHVKVGPSAKKMNPPEQHYMLFAYKTLPPRRQAQNVRGRLISANASLLEPPQIDAPVDGGYTESETFALRPGVLVQGDVPQQFMAVRLDYRDKATGEQLSQRFYYVWTGSQGGYFHSDFNCLPQTETDKFVIYLRKHFKEWEL